MGDNDHRSVALVTGAARGIGRAIALSLAETGFDLVVVDLEGDQLEETVAGIKAAGRSAHPLVADISEIAQHDGLLDEACAAFGTPTCLVNNAGISVAQRGDMLAASPESFDRLISVNLRGPFFLTQNIARRMLDVGSTATSMARSIINVSSANAYAASPDRAEYCLSKSALSMMTRLYALRLAEAGIGVYEIRPGVIRTAMTAVAQDRYDALFARGDFTPLNRWGEPQDVGQAAAMLAGGHLRFSTGDAIHVDGGLHIARL